MRARDRDGTIIRVGFIVGLRVRDESHEDDPSHVGRVEALHPNRTGPLAGLPLVAFVAAGGGQVARPSSPQYIGGELLEVLCTPDSHKFPKGSGACFCGMDRWQQAETWGRHDYGLVRGRPGGGDGGRPRPPC